MVDGDAELVGGGASEVLDKSSGLVGGTSEVACDEVGGGDELVGGSSDEMVEEGSQLKADSEVSEGGTAVVVACARMLGAVSPVFINVWANVVEISSENVLDGSSEVDVGGTEVVDESAEVIDVSTSVVDCCFEVADDFDEVFDVSPVVDNSTDAVEDSAEVVGIPSFVLVGCDEDACPVVVDI